MGIVRIDFERCKECGYCINFCPKNVLAKGAAVNKRGYFPPVVGDGWDLCQNVPGCCYLGI